MQQVIQSMCRWQLNGVELRADRTVASPIGNSIHFKQRNSVGHCAGGDDKLSNKVQKNASFHLTINLKKVRSATKAFRVIFGFNLNLINSILKSTLFALSYNLWTADWLYDDVIITRKIGQQLWRVIGGWPGFEWRASECWTNGIEWAHKMLTYHVE